MSMQVHLYSLVYYIIILRYNIYRHVIAGYTIICYIAIAD